MKKKLLIITPHFWPENFLINKIAEKIAKRDLNVTVLTGLPNYPKGEIYKNYKNIKKINIEFFNNVKIIRFPIYPRKKANSIDLALNYLSFVYNGIKVIKKINLKNEFDKILVYSISPITTALLAIYLKKKYKKKIFLWVQDLWPDSVKATGHIKNSLLLNILKLLVHYIYKRVDVILVQSSAFKSHINKIYKTKKMYVLENSHFEIADKKKYIVPSKINKLLNCKFCLTFAGNVGKAQSIETIINCALKLKFKKDILFLIIGSGSEINKISKLIKSKNLKNIKIFGPFNSRVANEICKKSSGLILSLSNKDIFNLTIPNKFQSYLHARQPILASCNGIVNQMVRDYKIGYSSQSGDEGNLVKNILKLYNLNYSEVSKIKIRMKNLYKNRFEINNQVNKLIKILFE